MKVKWLGHSCFVITSDKDVRIITDPYNVGGGLSYGQIKEAAEIVTISHDHGDHNNASAIGGAPQVLKGAGSWEVQGIKIRSFAAYHDESQGRQRGPDTIFCFTVDDLKVCHLGDLGHPLSEAQVKEIGAVDVLLTPVGGFYTIDSLAASQLCQQLKPRVVIPMHFKTPKCGYPISGVEDFLKGKTGVRRLQASEVGIKREQLPSDMEITVLQHAL